MLCPQKFPLSENTNVRKFNEASIDSTPFCLLVYWSTSVCRRILRWLLREHTVLRALVSELKAFSTCFVTSYEEVNSSIEKAPLLTGRSPSRQINSQLAENGTMHEKSRNESPIQVQYVLDVHITSVILREKGEHSKLTLLTIVRLVHAWTEKLSSVHWCKKQIRINENTTAKWNETRSCTNQLVQLEYIQFNPELVQFTKHQPFIENKPRIGIGGDNCMVESFSLSDAEIFSPYEYCPSQGFSWRHMP